VGEFVRSTDGNRFAFRVASKWLNFSDFPSVHRYTGVSVYGVAQRKAEFHIDFKPTFSHEEIALSPDGSLLAVSHDRYLDVFRIP